MCSVDECVLVSSSKSMLDACAFIFNLKRQPNFRFFVNLVDVFHHALESACLLSLQTLSASIYWQILPFQKSISSSKARKVLNAMNTPKIPRAFFLVTLLLISIQPTLAFGQNGQHRSDTARVADLENQATNQVQWNELMVQAMQRIDTRMKEFNQIVKSNQGNMAAGADTDRLQSEIIALRQEIKRIREKQNEFAAFGNRQSTASLVKPVTTSSPFAFQAKSERWSDGNGKIVVIQRTGNSISLSSPSRFDRGEVDGSLESLSRTTYDGPMTAFPFDGIQTSWQQLRGTWRFIDADRAELQIELHAPDTRRPAGRTTATVRLHRISDSQ